MLKRNTLLQSLTPRILTYVRTCSSAGTPELDRAKKAIIEKKWMHITCVSSFDEISSLPKCYVLPMIPYSSASLNMGHARVFTISDTLAWFNRIIGKNVLHPIGFDNFGLTVENAARELKVPIDIWSESNITTIREQLKSFGCSFDWAREITTSSPDYYKFTQYMFIKMFNAGLVYYKTAMVNWDPVDETALANEQVDEHKKSWSSGETVEKKIMKQWFLRTTYFSLPMKAGLDDLNVKGWSYVAKRQKKWIGCCNGSTFEFPVVGSDRLPSVSIWTKHPEYIGEAVFVVATPNSALNEVFGSDVTGKLDFHLLNPFNNRLLPVYISSEVEFEVGWDIKLGIPAVNKSDRKFADTESICYDCVSVFHVEHIDERIRLSILAMDAGIGGYPTSSKLQDWLVSRQRKWGTPIPIVHCGHCGQVPVPFEELPVVFPTKNIDTWVDTLCPKCQKPAKREKDTLDSFYDTAWYFLRFTDKSNKKTPFSSRQVNKMMPVDVYVGGKEHALLHFFYSRFFTYFLNSEGLLDVKEPFDHLIVQGSTLGEAYRIKNSDNYIPKDKTVSHTGKQIFEVGSGLEVEQTWEKMHRSKMNEVDLSKAINEYGIDTTRLIVLADIVPTSNKKWSSISAPPILSWQDNIWNLLHDFLNNRNMLSQIKPTTADEEEKIKDARNKATKEVTYCYKESHELNFAISALQSLTNVLKGIKPEVMRSSLEFEKSFATLIIMLMPMAPFFCCELWSEFSAVPYRIDETSNNILWNRHVFKQNWPSLDNDYPIEVILKVNNEKKRVLKMPLEQFKSLTHKQTKEKAFEDINFMTSLRGFNILRTDFQYIPEYSATLNVTTDHMGTKKSS